MMIMATVRLDPGKRSIDSNKRKLMRQGMSEADAFQCALNYANHHSGKRWESIHTATQREQRKRG